MASPPRSSSTHVSFEVEAAPPKPDRRPSLSRSGTLRLLAVNAQQSSTERNAYSGFNHNSCWHSVRWIFKGTVQGTFVPLCLITAFTTIIVFTVELEVGGSREDFRRYGLPPEVPVGLGGCMALLLAFRLNVCYSRFWEARLLWGGVIQGSRSLVTLLLSLEAEEEPGSQQAGQRRAHAEGVAGWCLAFAHALRLHLRCSPFKLGAAAGGGDGSQQCSLERLLKGKGLAFGSSAIERLETSRHPPLHALRSMRHALARIVSERRRSGICVTALEMAVYSLTDELHGALTGCERILRTPCPPGYVGVLRCAIFFFLAVLPFVLLEVGVGMIVIVAATAFVLLGAEEVAIQLEQPFGNDFNDLPLDSFCLTLEADLLVLLDERVEGVCQES